MSYSKSAQKTESIHVFFKVFWAFSFFLKNLPEVPLRDGSKNEVSLKCGFIKEFVVLLHLHDFWSLKSSTFIVKVAFWLISFFDLFLRGISGKFLRKNENAQKTLKSTWIDSVFCADFEYIILSIKIQSNLLKNYSKLVRKCSFWYPSTIKTRFRCPGPTRN